MLVSRGWGNAWKSCNDDIMSKLKFYINTHTDYKIVVTGWSYGGAIATLCCEDIYYRFKIKPTLITFGSPKPLFGFKSKKYVKSCCSDIIEYAHVNDVVPLVPPFNTHLNKVKIGKGFNIIKLFDPCTYHCLYGNLSLYK